MTRRHDSLVPLTHDHHHALKNARRLRLAADGSPAERVSVARAFIAFFRDDSVRHFREEEEELFPLVVGHPDAPMDGIARVLMEHVQMHATCLDLERSAEAEDVSPDLMLQTADLLKRHVRFEEDELFPAIERLIPGELETLRLTD